MSTVNVVHQAMREAIADVERARTRLEDGRNQADADVSSLLGGGWTGVAADSFGDAWEEWKVAAGQVRDGLDATAQLLDAVHRDLVEQDDGSQVALDRISQRIVERLG